jgi:hypothetical protein
MRIIIGSVISAPPFSPGMALNWMQHAVGFERLGHEVHYVEEVAPDLCVDAQGVPCPLAASENQRLFRDTMDRFGLLGRACLIHGAGEATFGMSLGGLADACRGADLLINISGHVKAPLVLEGVRRRVYFDQDPVYTQLWRAEYGETWNFDEHDVFLTVGLNIGTPQTDIPDCDREWRYALPPIVPQLWPDEPAPADGAFTTIASWWGDLYQLRFRGEWYGTKAEEFKRFASLARRVPARFEVALKKHESDDQGVRLLNDHGWTVTAASRIADIDSYRSYIVGSRAEIGIAKNAYVRARSGWFSDRTAHYLAQGRPALVQSTGFERHLPTGAGLLTFATLDEAAEGAERILRDYEAHARAAREIARGYLDYRKVLPKLLADCMSATPRAGAAGPPRVTT